MEQIQSFSTLVVTELRAMKEIGLKVPNKAIKMAQDLDVIKDFTNMRTADAADLIIDLC